MSLRTAVSLLLFSVLCSGLHAQTNPQLSFSSPLRITYAETHDASAIAVDQDGKIWVAGHYTYCCGYSGIWITKIDPVSPQLLWATNYIPTNDWWNSRIGLVVDSEGNAYLAGRTNDPNLSVYFDSVAGSLHGSADIMIGKFSPEGRPVWATYLGGSGWESFGGIGLDRADNIYLAGETSSQDFPLLNGQPPYVPPGFNDLFAAKLAPDGTLLYGTHLNDTIFGAFGVNLDGEVRITPPGSKVFALDPVGNLRFTASPATGLLLPFSPASLAVDDAANTYLVGPNIWNTYPDAPNPLNDVWAAKLSSSANLIYQKKVAGAAQDQARATAIDAQGDVYITGFTQSADYPLSNALQAALSGQQDAFVTALRPDGSALLYSTLLGGSDNNGSSRKDTGLAIAVKGNDVYLAGATNSLDFPVAFGLDRYDSYGGQAFVSVIAQAEYSLQLLYEAAKAHRPGSTVPVKIAVMDSEGRNVSSPELSVMPVRLTRVGDSTASQIEDAGQSSPDSTFRFDEALAPGGGYIFNLSTRGLSSGSYELLLHIGGDAYRYTVPLQLK